MRCHGTYVQNTGIVTVPEVHADHRTDRRNLMHPNLVVHPTLNANGLRARVRTTIMMLGRIVLINAPKPAQ